MFDFSVTLFRDSLATPWGFRLEGGRDYGTPLTVQRVFTGSPASADLQRGDQILSIEHRDAALLYHNQANDLIRNSGGSIHLAIRRGGGYAPPAAYAPYRPQTALGYSPQQSFHKTPVYNAYPLPTSYQCYGDDPTVNYIRSRPIEKLKDPRPVLSQTGSPMLPGETPYMNSHSTIKRYRPASTAPLFGSSAHPPAQYSHLPHTQFTAPQKPLRTNNVAQPFDKRMATQIHHSLTRAVAAPNRLYQQQQQYQPSFYQPLPPPQHQPSYQNSYPNLDAAATFSPQASRSSFLDYDPSSGGNAWSNSLKRTGIDLYQSQEPQQQFSKPTTSTTFHVGSFSNLSPGGNNEPASPNKSPKIVNLQYNSPIGLYSNKKIKEELVKQVGTQDVQFVPSSDF